MNIKFTLCVFLLMSLLAVGSVCAKPHSSLRMSLSWEDSLVYDQPVTVQVEVTSQVATQALLLRLTLPEGVELIEGKLHQTIEIEKNEPVFILYKVLISKGSTGFIEAEANLGEAGQVFFRAAKRLSIENPMALRKIQSDSTSTPAYRHTERNGVKLREYQLP